MKNLRKKLIGERISEIRGSHNMTLEEFGKVIGGATKSNVSKWEKGEVLPNRLRLKKIADFGNTTPEYLLTGIKNRYQLNFGQALEEMKDGAKVRLSYWEDSAHVSIEQSEDYTHPYFVVDSNEGSVPWTPTFQEILSEEWEIVKPDLKAHSS